MTYEETLDYLYTSTPVFQHSGASAYKPGLGTSIALDNLLRNPHTSYRTIHVAGTNGKGSTSHLLAAVLQQAGYKVGLYTSPHLVDFRERIRVNGKKISRQYVIDFIQQHKVDFEPLHPSFFELTSTMAFDYFRHEQVNIAVIETGLGGRLDSTNIITPVLGIITNISKDHVQFLGDSLKQIAREKAGIIKPHVPVVIGDIDLPEIHQVFEEKATSLEAPLYASLQEKPIKEAHQTEQGMWLYETEDYGTLIGALGGDVQRLNAITVLTALRILVSLGMQIPAEAVKVGFREVVALTGLMGRWMQLQDQPKVICDTAHNTGGWKYLSRQLKDKSSLRMIIGVVNDKDINGILDLMPRSATYYFTKASIERALPEEELAELAVVKGLHGKAYPTVTEAIKHALSDASTNDFIFIGGSTFIVADALPFFIKETD